MGDITLGNSGMKLPDMNYRQAENGVVIDYFSTFGENNWVNFGRLTKK